MPDITKNRCYDESPVKQEIETTSCKAVKKSDQTQNASVETDASRVSKTLLSKIKTFRAKGRSRWRDYNT